MFEIVLRFVPNPGSSSDRAALAALPLHNPVPGEAQGAEEVPPPMYACITAVI